MSDADWRVAFNSVIGTSHERTGRPCQDAGGCQIIRDSGGQEILLAVACDGAGSASRSRDGAYLTVAQFLHEFGDAAKRSGLVEIKKEFVHEWTSRLRAEIKERADAEGLSPREFACTVLAAIISEDRAVFFQIGDGAIVVSNRDEPDDYGWVFWPQHGEFANQTNFITQDNALDVLEFELGDRSIDEIAIFTDGIERLVLDLAEKTAHTPFFATLFRWLAKTDPAPVDIVVPTSPVLDNYLRSKPITDRTDDDKTLILATRRRTLTEKTAVVDADQTAAS